MSRVPSGRRDNVPTHLSASDILTLFDLYYTITHGLCRVHFRIGQASLPKSMISDTSIIYLPGTKARTPACHP